MSEFAARLVRLDARPEHADRDRRRAVRDAGAGRRRDTDRAARRRSSRAFGIVNEVKQADLLVAGAPAPARASDRTRTLAFVGRCSDEDRRNLLDLADALGVREHVDRHRRGRAPPSTPTWLDRAAVAAQLRRTSNGECSAAVADCMAGGVALIVTDIGASRELPAGLRAPDRPGCGRRRPRRGDRGPARRSRAARARMVEAARRVRGAHSFARPRRAALRRRHRAGVWPVRSSRAGREPRLVGRAPRARTMSSSAVA